jgi:hypothetical protein
MKQDEMEKIIPEVELRIRFKHESGKWKAGNVNILTVVIINEIFSHSSKPGFKKRIFFLFRSVSFQYFSFLVFSNNFRFVSEKIPLIPFRFVSFFNP